MAELDAYFERMIEKGGSVRTVIAPAAIEIAVRAGKQVFQPLDRSER